MSSWQTDLLSLRLQRFIEHVVAETATNSRAVSVYIPPEACRYIVETVIWEYEQCAIRYGNGPSLLPGPVPAQQSSLPSCLQSPTVLAETGDSDALSNP